MGEDSYTEVTQESWFGRIGDAIKGILFGVLLFVIAFPLLFWNEGRSVKRYKTLQEAGASVVSVDSAGVDKTNEGKLVHVTGKADSTAVLKDAVFGVSAKALKLNRVVEMYQWEEHADSKTEKKLGGGTEKTTTYTYEKTWSTQPIKSTEFKKSADHRNPATFPYEQKLNSAPDVTLGAYRLSSSLVGKIDNYQPLPAENASLPGALRGKFKVQDGAYYISQDPASPQVGDVRVSFRVVQPGEVSVMARQVGSTFEPYRTKAGGTIELLKTGTYSADELIQQEKDSNKILTWVLRFVGFLAMLIGLTLILKPLSVLADVLPILGTIVEVGTGVISFLIAAVLSLVTISIAWIVYRPLLGIVLLAVAAGLTFAIRTKLRTAKKPA